MANYKITLNNTRIEDFAIVYSNNENEKNYNVENAELLKNEIFNACGAELDIISDDTSLNDKKGLFIGSSVKGAPSCEKMNFCFKNADNGIYIVGGALMSNWLAVKKFATDYFSNITADTDITVSDISQTLLDVVECPKTCDTEFRVMTYNILAEYPSWGTYLTVDMRKEALCKIIDVYDPDVIGIQEVSEQWIDVISNDMSQYASVYQYTPDGKFINMSTILYKTAKFDLVDSGLQYYTITGPNKIRLVTWAIFKDKATSKKFAFFNTHWMFFRPGDEIRKAHSEENAVIINAVMAAHPDVKYAFSTADYNTVLEHEFIKNFIKNANLVNTLDIAKAAGTLQNEVGGCRQPGLPRKDMVGGGSIDNIFVTNNVQVTRHETILWNAVEHISDHSPKYADIILD